jgi:4-carboxymuconolactone decarboxylase
MSDDERRRVGEEWFKKIYGDGVPIPTEQMQDPFLDLMFKQLFGEVWPREGLSLRDRRLMAIGVLAALGEALIFLAPYVGYPRTSRLRPILLRILAKFENKTDAS